MPPRDSHDHARLLLSKARADKVVIDKLAHDRDVTDETIGFHAQQAVEKLLKAVLANRAIEYPRTHDIDRLVDLLAANDAPMPPQARRLDELTPWATQLRYDELLDIEHLDREEAIALVEGVINWANGEIQPSP